MDTETEPKLASNFLEGENPGVVITSAEVDFLLAEAALKGWNVAGSVEEHYRKGVRAAMDFLTDNYGCDKVTDEEFDNYMANNIIGYTVEQKRHLSIRRHGFCISPIRWSVGLICAVPTTHS